MNDEELSDLIQRHATRHRASPRLRAAVQTQMALHVATQARRPRLAGLTRGWSSERLYHLALGWAAGTVLTLALVWLLPRLLVPGVPEVPAEAMAAELLDLHVQALRVGPLFEVASSDRHTVKPWFQGRLDYAPEVADLQDAGFDLLGARVDRVRGHASAALAYGLHQHRISVFVLPQERAAPLQHLQRRGFQLVHWGDGAMQVWAVSDADVGELDRFAAAWLAKMARPASAAP
jgi:anti-sigma factor RsiW